MKPSLLLSILLTSLITFFILAGLSSATARSFAIEEGCGLDHHNQTCGYPYSCCSIHGHCGNTVYYCAPGNCLPEFGTCWDNVPPPPPPSTPSPEPSLVHIVEEGCGPDHHNQSCGYPYHCCSIHGHCGDSIYYCAPGNCLPEFGTCWDNVPPPPPTSPSPEHSLVHAVEEGCGPDHHNQTCGYPYPCCSIHGHCGDTIYYCAPGNCLPEFGTCWDNVPPPPPPTPYPEPSLVQVVEEGCGTEHHNQTCGYPYPCCSIHGHCGDSVYYCAPGNCLPEFGICWDNVPPPPPESNHVSEDSLVRNVFDKMELLYQF